MKKKTDGNGTAGPDRSEKVLRWLAMVLALACFVAAAACGGDEEGTGSGDARTVDTWVVAQEPDWQTAASAGDGGPATNEPPAGEAPVNEPPASPPVIPEESRLATWADAEGAFHAGRYGEAIDLFSIYAEEHPTNPWAHYMLGLSGWKAGHLDVAETHLRESIELAPDDVKSRINLARVLIEGGRPGDAIEQAAAAEALDPASIQAKRVHARALAESGDHATALDKYEDALWIHPDDGWSLNNMGYLLIRQGSYDDAIGPLALAVQVDSTNVTFLNNFGSALEGAGFPVAALAAFRSAAEIDPSGKAAESARRLEARIDPDAVPEVTRSELAQVYRELLVIGSSARSDSAGRWFPHGSRSRKR